MLDLESRATSPSPAALGFQIAHSSDQITALETDGVWNDGTRSGGLYIATAHTASLGSSIGVRHKRHVEPVAAAGWITAAGPEAR